MKQNKVQLRILILAALALLWMSTVFGRLAYLQLMRHSDIKLTMGTYTHTSALALAEAVEKLPTYSTTKSNAPGNAPKLVNSSLTVSSGVPWDVLGNSGNTVDNIEESLPLSPGVPWWQQEEMVRAAGFEPATPTV